MKVLVFIDHDILYRHFVRSGAFAHLAERHSLAFVLPEAGESRFTLDPSDSGAPILRLGSERPRVHWWRRIFQVDQMRWRPGADWRKLRRTLWYVLGWKAALLTLLLSLPGIRQVHKKRLLARLEARPYRALVDLLDRENPDVVLHPTVLDGLFLNDLIAECGRRMLPLVCIMNSWDNPSTKRSVVGSPPWLLVWGEQTRRHAVRYIRMPAERAVPFGAAQFEVFRSPPRVSRETFCRNHGIDPAKRVVMYAGATKSADEFSHLVKLDELIGQGRFGDVALVYRPHPWGRGGVGGDRILSHPWRNVHLDNSMRSYLAAVAAGSKEMYMSDYRDTHDVLSSVDAVISPMSTILIEAALHGKPICCYLANEEHSAAMRVRAAQPQFEELFADPDVLIAYDLDLVERFADLAEKAADPLVGDRLRASCRDFVAEFDRPFGERLTAFVEGLVAKSPDRQLGRAQP